MALQWAAENGHLDCVNALIPVSDPKGDDGLALYMAAENGHLDCVKALIPVSDLAAQNHDAVRSAATRGHVDCVAALLTAYPPLQLPIVLSLLSDMATLPDNVQEIVEIYRSDHELRKAARRHASASERSPPRPGL